MTAFYIHGAMAVACFLCAFISHDKNESKWTWFLGTVGIVNVAGMLIPFG